MAYERIFRRIALSLLSFFDVLTSLAFSAWRFIDITAHVSLAIDALSRAFSAVTDKASSFRAFVSRALKHDHWTAGHFDPGRMTA